MSPRFARVSARPGVNPQRTKRVNLMRILVAEDDAMQREIVDAHLRSWGYEPTLCEHGGQVCDALAADDPPSLLLLDWNMPVVDGLELCRRIRDSE